MQSLVAIATFLVLAGGVVFGISRYRNSVKSEQPRELQVSMTVLPPVETALLSEGMTQPIREFEPPTISDPWESDLTSTIAAPHEEVMPD